VKKKRKRSPWKLQEILSRLLVARNIWVGQAGPIISVELTRKM
jgi:hypothetical protein